MVVDVGRQLFVDSFLLDPSATNATTTFHAPAELHEAPPTTKLGGGGLWWDATAAHFKSFHTCSLITIKGDGALGPLCLSTSPDGITWEGTTVVHNFSAFSRSVLLDEGAAAGQRWKLAQVEMGPAQKTIDLVYQLYTSADGLTWTRQAPCAFPFPPLTRPPVQLRFRRWTAAAG